MQKDYFIQMNIFKGFFDTLYDLLIEDFQKTAIFSFWCQFSRSKINFVFLRFVFLYEYQIRRTNFDILNSLISKHVKMYQTLTALNQTAIQDIRKSFLFIQMYKFIEFDLSHYEIPQLSSHFFPSIEPCINKSIIIFRAPTSIY